ncbi:MAG TPA: ATP-binding protein [Bacteroidales bacterium]|nr:ATP-binding protein [Bacteroidales bacterium]
MVLKSFYINILVRVAFIVLSSMILAVIVHNIEHGYYYTLAGMLILIGIQALLLINVVNRTNADLIKFFSSVHDHDSSIRFPADNNSFEKLRQKLNELNSTIQQIRMENEKSAQFLQTVVNHVSIGLMSFDHDGNPGIFNRAVKEFINVNHPGTLKIKDPDLYQILQNIQPGHEILHKIKIKDQLQSILIRATELKFENRVIRLISFENITRELDRKELDSWQRLIRVLTHEIMNSVSPVTSLTSVISGYFKENGQIRKPGDISERIINKTLEGLNTIEETGKGLLDFVDTYRTLTALPKSRFSPFKIANLFSSCKLLMDSGISDKFIQVEVNPPDLMLTADFSQVEQVLINLVKNATEALENSRDGAIRLSAFYQETDVIIRVEDNGPGIPDEIITDIFMPFFTTKANGSGIGLSLSKQIMQNHNGTLSVVSDTNGTIFTLAFPL